MKELELFINKLCWTLTGVGVIIAGFMIAWASFLRIVGATNSNWQSQSKDIIQSIVAGLTTLILGPWLIKIVYQILKAILP